MSEESNNIITDQEEPTKKRKSLARRLFKGFFIGLLSLIVLLVILICSALYILSPKFLTPWFEDAASEYLDADVTAKRVELTFWRTFPRLTLEIEDVKVRSRKLDMLSDTDIKMLPANADSLLYLKRLRGGVNFWSLIHKEFRLYDVELDNPNLFLVKVNDSINNYDIFPHTHKDSIFHFPDVTIDNFKIVGEAPIRYYSAVDSTDIQIHLKSINIDGEGAPLYAFDVKGSAGGNVANNMKLPQLPLGIDGKVRWSQYDPRKIALEGLKINVLDMDVAIDANIEFDTITVFRDVVVTAKDFNMAKAKLLLPSSIKSYLEGVETDITFDMKAKILSDYVIGSENIPNMRLELNIRGGMLYYDQVTIDDLQANITAFIDGTYPNGSVVDINSLKVRGETAEFSMYGQISSPLYNPQLKGKFSGMMSFNTIPPSFAEKLPFAVTGKMKGETEFDFRMNDLSQKGFHNINADGTLLLDDMRLAMRDSSAKVFTNHAQFDFGTLSSYEKGGEKLDSLLRVTITADSIHFRGEGVNVSSKGLRLSAGTKNTVTSFDTTKINPLGILVSAEKLRIQSLVDSMNLNLTNAKVIGQLQRYNNQATSALLTLDISTGRLRYSDPVSRVSLEDAKLNLQVHPKSRSKGQLSALNIFSAKGDSDSTAFTLSMKEASSGHKDLNFNLDQTLMSWLQHWDASGIVRASGGRLMTPYFPVKNTLRNVDVKFSTDSMVIKNIDYQMGKSDLNIKGKISNIAEALTSTDGAPLLIDITINCDTLDANNITSAILSGSAYADKVTRKEIEPISTLSLKDTDRDDDHLESRISKHMSDSARAPFVVPWNIDARFAINANSLLYADIWFQKMQGRVNIKDGAIEIDRLAGYTPIGSMDISALYAAPTKDDIRFAGGIVVRELHIKQFLHLLPEIEKILPLLKEVNGIITADVAMTTELDSLMNMKFNTFDLVLKLQGKDLTLADNKEFMKIAKLLRLEHDGKITIDDMKVEMMVKDSHLDLFPFVFNFGKYKFGVSGGNDLGGDLDYHIAVLKSPIPFKFGVTIKGRKDHLHFRLGRANFDENKIASSHLETDTARINLVEKIERVFKFGVKNGHRVKLMEEVPKVSNAEFLVADTLTRADSLIFMQAGFFEGEDIPPFPETWEEVEAEQLKADKKAEKERRKEEKRLRKEEKRMRKEEMRLRKEEEKEKKKEEEK